MEATHTGDPSTNHNVFEEECSPFSSLPVLEAKRRSDEMRLRSRTPSKVPCDAASQFVNRVDTSARNVRKEVAPKRLVAVSFIAGHALRAAVILFASWYIATPLARCVIDVVSESIQEPAQSPDAGVPIH